MLLLTLASLHSCNEFTTERYPSETFDCAHCQLGVSKFTRWPLASVPKLLMVGHV
jgi:hypothetical protein